MAEAAVKKPTRFPRRPCLRPSGYKHDRLIHHERGLRRSARHDEHGEATDFSHQALFDPKRPIEHVVLGGDLAQQLGCNARPRRRPVVRHQAAPELGQHLEMLIERLGGDRRRMYVDDGTVIPLVRNDQIEDACRCSLSLPCKAANVTRYAKLNKSELM